MPDRWGFETDWDEGDMTHRCRQPGCDFPSTWRVVPDEEREQHYREHQRAQYLDDHPEERELRARLDRQAADRRERRHRSRSWQVAHQPRVCAYEYCSETFTPRRSDQRYHADRCRKADSRRQL
jgi:hypothetical protein